MEHVNQVLVVISFNAELTGQSGKGGGGRERELSMCVHDIVFGPCGFCIQGKPLKLPSDKLIIRFILSIHHGNLPNHGTELIIRTKGFKDSIILR